MFMTVAVPRLTPLARCEITPKPGGYHGLVDTLELFFTGLLVLTSVVIGWFSCYVVYRLFSGQR
ncbi:MAG: hypothetical protein ACRC0L_08855 [Angustibacter sp.]